MVGLDTRAGVAGTAGQNCQYNNDRYGYQYAWGSGRDCGGFFGASDPRRPGALTLGY